MRTILVEVLVPGVQIDQSNIHPRDRTSPEYTDDVKFKYTTLAKPDVGDLVHFKGGNYRFRHVIQVLDTMLGGCGEYSYTKYFQVTAEKA
ncbi:hypothetical protein Roomu2_00078 [Pseudomonas phage vB_PpuM-Roomu-2]|uniref:Uncharacterized protein n=2 Tax=Tartuvirus TaxID=3424912 RepID=A0AAX4MYT0_9CAUD